MIRVITVFEFSNKMMVWMCEYPIFRSWHLHPWYNSSESKGTDIYFDNEEDATAFLLAFKDARVMI